MTEHAQIVNVWKGDGGEYGMSLVIPFAASLGAGSDMLCLWWNGPNIKNPNLRFRLRSVKPRYVVTTAFSAAAAADLALFVARGMTASDTGGTAKLPPSGMQKKWTVMKDSQVADLRISTAGAALTNGTRTLDTYPIKTWGGWGGAVGLAFPSDESVMHPVRGKPIILGGPLPIPPNQGAQVTALQEGLILQNITAIPATGAATVYVDIEWDEINALLNPEELMIG